MNPKKVAIVGRATAYHVAGIVAYIAALPEGTVVVAPRIPSTAYQHVMRVAKARNLEVVKVEQPVYHNGRHILESSGRFVLSTLVMKEADLVVAFNDGETLQRNEPLFEHKKDLMRDLVEFQVRHGVPVEYR